jgi:RNA recognition motif-containing protein
MNIYVGNLSYNVTEDSLRSMFEAFGGVVSAKLIMDRDTGQSKGFGFVDLNGNDNDGRALKVNVAKPREQGNKGRRNRY